MHKWWMFKMNSWGLQDQAKGDGDPGGSGGGGGGGDDDAAAKAKAEAEAAAAAAAAKKPTDEEAKLLKEVMQKKEALQKTQADLTAAQERLKEFDGIDPAEIKKLLQAQKDAETAQLEAKGEYERVKQRMAEEHANQTKSLQEQIDALKAQLGQKDGAINELSIGAQFAQSTFIAEELTLTPSKARVVYGEHFDVVDGKVVAFDKPRGATNRTALVDQYGNNVGFDEALRKIVDADPDKDALLRSKVKPGAGSDSKKADPKPKQEIADTSTGKIANGLKSLNLLNTGKIA